jgi:hypothetical protein
LYWELEISESGVMTATLVGTTPPLKVSASDLESLRKKIKELIMRALL